MNPEERNAHLFLPPGESDSEKIREAQFAFLATEIAIRKLDAHSREEFLRIVQAMDGEVQEIAGLQTAAEQEAAADHWEDIMLLGQWINAMADANMERGGDDVELFTAAGPHPDVARAHEILHQQGLIRKKPSRLAAWTKSLFRAAATPIIAMRQFAAKIIRRSKPPA